MSDRPDDAVEGDRRTVEVPGSEARQIRQMIINRADELKRLQATLDIRVRASMDPIIIELMEQALAIGNMEHISTPPQGEQAASDTVNPGSLINACRCAIKEIDDHDEVVSCSHCDAVTNDECGTCETVKEILQEALAADPASANTVAVSRDRVEVSRTKLIWWTELLAGGSASKRDMIQVSDEIDQLLKGPSDGENARDSR